MASVYTVEFEGVAVTAAQDFFWIAPADDQPCWVTGLFLSQSSDVGDAAEEILRFRAIRGHTTVGSGGAAKTPTAIAPTGGAAGFTARTNDTVIASLGTPANVHSDGFNVRTGLAMWLPEGHEWRATQAAPLVVRLLAAPTDSLTMSGTIYVREIR